MTLESASSGLGQNMSLNPAASTSPFPGQPFLPPAPTPAPQASWEQPLPPFLPAPCSQGHLRVLATLARTPSVAGDGGCEPRGPFNIVFQVGMEGQPAGPPSAQNAVLAQAPVSWGAPGPLRGGVGHPAPFLRATSAPMTIMPAVAGADAQPHGGSWPRGLAPPGPPPLATLAPIAPPVMARPWPHQAGGEGSLADSQAGASTDSSCKHESVYENFRHWQHFKTLVRRTFPGTPDVAALSCFLIPVLRTLCRREPTMSLEDGLWRGLQEWQRTSNFDRMIFHEMAEKFTEFEAAEEMENPKQQLMGEFQCRPPAAPPRPGPLRPSAPEVAQQPVCTPRKAGPKSRAARPSASKRPLPPHSKAPKEIPPEAVQEYIDIMEGLLGHRSAPGEPGRAWEDDGAQQLPKEDGSNSHPDILSYINKLCSQKDFVTKVEAIIHPQFLAELLSPQPAMDILALSKMLEQEEGLTPDQLVEKRLLSSKEKGGVWGPRNRRVPQLDSSASKSAACRGEEQDGRGAQRVGTEACSPSITSQELERRRATDAALLGPKDAAKGSARRESPSLGATWAHTGDRSATSASLGPRGPAGPSRACPAEGPRGTAVDCSEEDDDLPSLAFLLASQHRLLPWGLSRNQGPGPDHLCPGAPAPQQRRGLHLHLRPAAKSKKQALTGGSSQLEKAPCSGPVLDGASGPDVALELAHGSQPQKRKCVSSGLQKMKKKKH